MEENSIDMINAQQVVISEELAQNPYFCCNLRQCKGACCVAGDAGAPLEHHEIEQIIEALPEIKPFMQEQCAAFIDESNVFEYDPELKLVTTLWKGRECIFTNFDNTIAFCSIEKAFLNGKISFRKPQSCYLYPIRLEQREQTYILKYHKWNICKSAKVYGKNTDIQLLEFLKQPLTETFGDEWYQALLNFLNKKS